MQTQEFNFIPKVEKLITLLVIKDGSTVRLKCAYYVPRTLNRTVPAYCSYFSSIFEAYRTYVPYPYHYEKGVPYQRTVPTYRTRTTTKKAYRTSVPYVLIKIKAYRNYVAYRFAILAFNYSQL